MDIMSRDEMTEALKELEERLAAKLAAVVTMDTERTYMDKRQAAEYLGVSRATLDRLANSGEVRRARIGEGNKKPIVRFRRSDLDAFVERRLELDAEGARQRAQDISL